VGANRSLLAVLLAVALHGLFGWAVRVSSSPSRPLSSDPTARSSASSTWLEIDTAPVGLDTDATSSRHSPATHPLDTGDGKSRAQQHRDNPLSPAAANPDAPPALGDAAPEQPSEQLAMLPESALPPASDVPPGPSIGGPPAVPAPTGTIDLGIGNDAWQRWIPANGQPLARGSEMGASKHGREPLVRAPVASTTGGLREGLEARDHALGLGPSGRVISALHAAARHRDAPTLGKARFEVTVLRTGAVEVSVSAASEPAGGWEPVAVRAAEALRRNPPRIPSGRAGTRLVLDVVAESSLPNGMKSKSLRGPRLQASAPRLRSTEQSKKELTDLNPTAGTDAVPLSETLANADVPGLYVSGQGSVCGYKAGVTPLGTLQAPSGNDTRSPGTELRVQGACDPAHIGAKSQRVVRVAIREQAMF
jgi:hypothetical protein